MATDGKGTTFTHDGRNRLIKAVKGEATTLVYDYAVSGYRIQSIMNPTGVDAAGKATGGLRTRYVLSGSEEVADIDANKNVIARYVPGPAIDERVAQVDANGAVSYIHTDRRSSVIALSDLAGNVTHRRGYGDILVRYRAARYLSTYGETNPIQMTGTGAQGHPFGYTGRRWEGDLGLYYYRARWYDPELGTFLQTDPIGSLDYINLYSYVGLEPGNGTDPTGKFCFNPDTSRCPPKSSWPSNARDLFGRPGGTPARQRDAAPQSNARQATMSNVANANDAYTATKVGGLEAMRTPQASAAARQVGRMGGTVSAVITVAGEGMRAQDRINTGTPRNEAIAGAGARSAVTLGAQGTGAWIGAALGSFAPGPGNVAGGFVGGLVGGYAADKTGATKAAGNAAERAAKQ
jgi:RHS repeat-associated protein